MSQDLYVYRKAKALAEFLVIPYTGDLGWNYGYLMVVQNLLDMGEKMLMGEDVSAHVVQFSDLFDDMANQKMVWDEEEFMWKGVEDPEPGHQEETDKEENPDQEENQYSPWM